jgi:hypothetical protein
MKTSKMQQQHSPSSVPQLYFSSGGENAFAVDQNPGVLELNGQIYAVVLMTIKVGHFIF